MEEQIPTVKPGKLVFIFGLSGSGKTTLIGNCLSRMQGLKYIRTITTRPPRTQDELVNSFEYTFVSKDIYWKMYEESNNWDHSEIHGNFYGVDIEKTLSTLEYTSLILNVYPDMELIQRLSRIYRPDSSIYISSQHDHREKIIKDSRGMEELSRLTVESDLEVNLVKQHAEYIFIPEYNIDKDIQSFSFLLYNILSS